MHLILRPITLREANAFVGQFHRHHKAARGHKFSVAVDADGKLCGVAIVGRPVARHDDDGLTFEVVRLCTDGTRNACSMLYGAAWRAAKGMGYLRGVTFTMAEETGASLRASGWRRVRDIAGRSWDTPSRARTDKHPLGPKVRWEIGEAKG